MESPTLGTTGLAPPNPINGNGSRPRRRSALSLAERVTALVSLRRGSATAESSSRSRAGSDAVSPQSPTRSTQSASASSSTLHLGLPLPHPPYFGGSIRRSSSRDNSTDREDADHDHESTSEDIHSMDDSFEFGLLEGDPFANLSTPPSECHSPVSRSWLRTLSTDVITEEPEEREETRGELFGDDKQKGGATEEALDSFSARVAEKQWFDDEDEGNDGDVSTSNHEHQQTRTPAPSPERDGDIRERKRSNSFTQRVRNIVQARPSLPSLSLLANTKIFIPAASSKSGFASRFPSEPWDDPKYSISAGPRTLNGDHNVVTVPSHGGGDNSSGGGGGWSAGHRGDASRGGGGGNGSQGRDFPSHSTSQSGRGGGDGNGWQPPRKGGGPTSHSTTEENTSDDESGEDSDDLPLGQRPNALSAQKSLRKQIKDERRSRKETIKQAAHSLIPAALISSSKDPKTPTPVKLSADDLTARLLHLRANADSLPASPTGRTAFPTLSATTSPQVPPAAHSSPYEQYQPFSSAPALNSPPSNKQNISSPSLIHASTFAFPSRSANPATPPPMRRHATDSRAHHYHPPTTADAMRPKFPERSMTSFDSQRGDSGAATTGMTSQTESRRTSHDNNAQLAPTRSRADTLIQKMGGLPANYTAKIRQRANSLHSTKNPGPPRFQGPQTALPPLPQPRATPSLDSATDNYGSGSGSGSGVQMVHSDNSSLMQQRIFVGNMQRFSVVEIGMRTNAREVLADVVARGDLSPEEAKARDWMLFEIANDFGMERPIREFEIVMEVYNSWNSETRMNYFMLKPTNLASQLAATAIPKSSPTFGGYVEWEHKRGRWQKRWLELREHGLWLSKRQGAKDATTLCTLANFDVYNVTRVHRSPKPFIFSVKSVQNMRMFENLSDYHHVFSCDAQEGAQWLQNILLARSYVLHQERAVLFRSLNPPTTRPVARSTTKRAPPAPLLFLDQSRPLPSIPTQAQAHSSGSTAVDNFNPMPGSLLAKRA